MLLSFPIIPFGKLGLQKGSGKEIPEEKILNYQV